METYRSGHNENDSKSFCLHGHMGSNPIVSVFYSLAVCGGFLFLTNKVYILFVKWYIRFILSVFGRRICKGMRYLKQLKKGKIKGIVRAYGFPILFGIIFACVLVCFVRPSQIEGESKVI